MTEIKVDPVDAAVQKLRGVLSNRQRGSERWVETLHERLGQLCDATKRDVHVADQSKKDVGEMNPDFQNVPIMERHTEGIRAQMIKLNERAHQLRADVRRAREAGDVDGDSLCSQAEELAAAIDELRRSDDKFILDTVNSNPGAGE